MTRVVELWLAVPVDPWRRLGFPVSASPRGDIVAVPGLDLLFVDPLDPPAITGWTLSRDGAGDEITDVDGIPTRVVFDATMSTPVDTGAPKPFVITGVDHIVINTGSLDRTCGEIGRLLDLPMKRIRDAGHGVRQGFHRAGSIILEVVERPDLEGGTLASLWGLVFNVDDLDAAAEWFGPDAIGTPRNAVQPGRRIATVRGGAGLGVPLALMSTERG